MRHLFRRGVEPPPFKMQLPLHSTFGMLGAVAPDTDTQRIRMSFVQGDSRIALHSGSSGCAEGANGVLPKGKLPSDY